MSGSEGLILEQPRPERQGVNFAHRGEIIVVIETKTALRVPKARQGQDFKVIQLLVGDVAASSNAVVGTQ